MGAKEGNGAGVLSAPSIAEASPVTSSAPSPAAARDGKPVEGGGSQPDPAALARAAIDRNTWGAVMPDGRTVGAHLDALVERRRRGDDKPVATPWESVNAQLGGGFWPGLHVIVGSTGSGKSQFAMQTAMHAATEHGTPALYVSLELDALGLRCRAAALVMRAQYDRHEGPNRPTFPPPWSAFYTGRAGIPAAVSAELSRLPFHWLEPPPRRGFSYDAIVPHVEALRARYEAGGYARTAPVVVVVDFLQLVAAPEGVREDTRERVSGAAYACREVARTCNAVVLALSSTARAPGNKGDPLAFKAGVTAEERFAPGDLVGTGKESGDVEYSADSVLVLCREAWPAPEKNEAPSPPRGGTRTHVAVAKLRAGRSSWSVLAFDGSTFRPAPDNDDAPAEHGDAATSSAPAKPRRGAKRKSSAPPTPDPREQPDDTREDD